IKDGWNFLLRTQIVLVIGKVVSGAVLLVSFLRYCCCKKTEPPKEQKGLNPLSVQVQGNHTTNIIK
ncbi:MAG: hypothetical protein LBR09_01630, partial [Endomicrobium sp.]|nr:hypothetical protein [Endomicrobium sp.]